VMAASLVRSTRRSLSLRRCAVGVSIAVQTGLLMSSCGSGLAANPAQFHPAHIGVFFLPELEGGAVGWCITADPGLGCPVERLYRGPIVGEAWFAAGPPSRTEGIVVTRATVESVSVEGQPRIPTRVDPGLPVGVRALVVTAPGRTRGRFPRFRAFDAHGDEMVRVPETGVPAIAISRGRTWTRPQVPATGVCDLASHPLRGLVASAGFVVTRITRATNVPGRPFLSCASNSYKLNGWSLVGSVLVDARRPGTKPAPLPAIKPVPGLSNVFVALGSNGEMVARQIPMAWLVVSGGAGQRQRLAVLAVLRAALHRPGG